MKKQIAIQVFAANAGPKPLFAEVHILNIVPEDDQPKLVLGEGKMEIVGVKKNGRPGRKKKQVLRLTPG